MNTYTPSCIACACLLSESAVPTDFGDIPGPHAATLFTSTGNYGSTVWDPQADGRLQLMIWVCDPCLITNAQEGVVLHLRSLPMPPIHSLGVWRGDEVEPMGQV